MKLAFIGYMHGYGGAEKQIVNLANSMFEAGHDVSFISICNEQNCFTLDKGIKTFYIPERFSGAKKIANRFFSLKKILKEIRPDITINFWFQSAYFLSFMKKAIYGRIIYAERGDPGDSEYSGLLGLIRKISIKKIDGFVFQSKGALNYFDIEVQNKSVIIHNPCFIKRGYEKYNPNSKTLISVGRLHPQKNQKMLIDAFYEVQKELPFLKLHIWGDGCLENSLKEQIKTLGLEDKVLLKGTTKDILYEISKAVIFVLSSDFEGLPNVLIEAMALGIPSISTDCKPGGAREIISDNEMGMIVPINDKTFLAKAIVDLYNDKERRKKMSNAGLNVIEKFDSVSIYKEWENFFKKIID